MVGVPGAPYHLEFTRQHEHRAGRAPTQDNLLVFYLPDEQEWQAAVDRMVAAGYSPVPSLNPYWDRTGRTFEDSGRLPGGASAWDVVYVNMKDGNPNVDRCRA